jgi:2-hydroxy-6-oxonona-2,4-dienedioate hydrolase
VIEEAATTSLATSRTARYRQAEQRLWEHYGLQPRERFLELARPPVRLRVVEVGVGSPVLFCSGSGGTGPGWAPLLAELDGYRCLLLDPPNSGLSSRLDYTGRRYGDTIVEVLRGVADRLELERLDVVGFSIGNVSALRLAEAEPQRVGRVALLGAGPFLEGWPVPGILRAIASPIGALLVRLPPGRRAALAFLRQIGHARSLKAGRIAEELIDWRVAFDRDTDTLRNERAMVRALTDWRRGSLRAGVTFTESELRHIVQPTLLVYGSDDPTGSLAALRPVVEALPHGEFRIVERAGHVLWLDDPAAVAGAIASFLTSTESEVPR